MKLQLSSFMKRLTWLAVLSALLSSGCTASQQADENCSDLDGVHKCEPAPAPNSTVLEAIRTNDPSILGGSSADIFKAAATQGSRGRNGSATAPPGSSSAIQVETAALCNSKDSDLCSHEVNDTPVPGVSPGSAASTPSEPQQASQIAQSTAAQSVTSASPLLAIEQLSAKSGVASLCDPNETTVWSGVKGVKVYSLCASQGLGATGGYMQYRAGKVGQVEFKYPATLVNPHGHFTLSMLAHSVELEFKNGDFTYDINEQADGSSTEIDVSKSEDSTYGASIVMTQATTTLAAGPTMDLFKSIGDSGGL